MIYEGLFEPAASRELNEAADFYDLEQLGLGGTRITVEQVLEELGSGRTIEQLLEAHPRLTRDGVLAALVESCVVDRLRGKS
jgi:hypothetical protein